jgi:tripartite-type tricarboxylate transporter receptor subunit TctC
MTGANIAHVPYKGAAPAVADVIGGHVTMTFVPIAAAVPPVKSGRLRALGVTGSVRATALPDVMTISEAGVAGYEATSWNALLAPGATPRDIVLRIHSSLAESLRAPKVREILANSGADAAGSLPGELATFLRTEMVKWGKVVRAAGIQPE